MSKKTLVIGASENTERYSYKAIQLLRSYGHEVVAIGNKTGFVGDVVIENEKKPFNDIDTITLYINPVIQRGYYDYILATAPKRIIFNPGTENNELAELANSKGIATEDACTLVLLRTGQY